MLYKERLIADEGPASIFHGTALKQSLAAVKFEGIASVIEFLGTGVQVDQPLLIEALFNQCVVRGILVGSRLVLEDINRAIEANNTKPVIDKKVFKLADVKEADQYVWDQKHFRKVVVEIA